MGKKGQGKKKPKHLLILILLPVLLGCIVFLKLIIGFSDSSGGVSPPFYEEIYSSSSVLNEKIRKIDSIIYEALYEGGVHERNILFLKVQPRHQKGYVWDYAEILVKCHHKESVLSLHQAISQGLNALGEGIHHKKQKDLKDRIISSAFVNSIETHRLILSVDSQLPSSKVLRPKLAIVVDDLGYNANSDFLFFKLDLPLSFSVLPHGPATQSIVKTANEKGHELILHLPMEPKNYPSLKPGPGGLYLSMAASEIRRTLDQDLEQIIGVRGVNNHMGSSFTENREKMLIVLKELKKRNLFFIDSRTTKDTVALDLSRDIGLPAARRRVFLDNNLDPKALKIQMERLLNMARHRGKAIGICHPYKETYLLLKQYRSIIKNEFQIVPVSDLVS